MLNTKTTLGITKTALFFVYSLKFAPILNKNTKVNFKKKHPNN